MVTLDNSLSLLKTVWYSTLNPRITDIVGDGDGSILLTIQDAPTS